VSQLEGRILSLTNCGSDQSIDISADRMLYGICQAALLIVFSRHHRNEIVAGDNR